MPQPRVNCPLGTAGHLLLSGRTMDNNYYFDDIVVANDPAVASDFLAKTWTPKHEAEV